MRQITAVEQQKKPGSKRLNVYLDGNFAFSLVEDLAATLRPGDHISDVDVAELRRQDGLHQVYDAALNLLSYRPRSVAELRSRLQRKDFDPQMIDDVLAKLETQRVISDEEFASYWVENRQAHNPRGSRLLRAELRYKGVEREIIEGALPGPESEDEAAYRVALAKARSLSHLDWREFRRRLGDYLLRRGFGYETAGAVCRRVWTQEHETPDDDAADVEELLDPEE